MNVKRVLDQLPLRKKTPIARLKSSLASFKVPCSCKRKSSIKLKDLPLASKFTARRSLLAKLPWRRSRANTPQAMLHRLRTMAHV
ncbi:MAG: hypothetical protein ABFR97_05985 [Thermodesulfobacteriota bacterium]